jgi:hypothetical protein
VSEIFIRVELDDKSGHEWGWSSSFVPAVGDIMWLYYELPDSEQTGNNYLEAVVVKRQVIVGEDEVWLTVHSDETVPHGFVADSPEWPSDEVGKRRRELDEMISRSGDEGDDA